LAGQTLALVLGGKLQRPHQFGAIISTWNPIDRLKEVFQVKLSNPILIPAKASRVSMRTQPDAVRWVVLPMYLLGSGSRSPRLSKYRSPVQLTPVNKSLYISNQIANKNYSPDYAQPNKPP
jgi:hypothetical protein